jgi:hypothetical protein
MVVASIVALSGTPALAQGSGQPSAPPSAGPQAAQAPDPAALAQPDSVLPKDWRNSTDRAIAVSGDGNGLHVLVADEASGYTWRTAATLADNTFDTDQWIGQGCLTGSGDRAVVVYAPRRFTNAQAAMDHGGLVAIVDLRTGGVTKLGVHASLAYFNPGCGAGETATVTALTEAGTATTSAVTLIDASTGTTTAIPAVTGALTSAVPFGTGIAAARGTNLVSITPSGAVTTVSTEKGVPFRLHPDRSGGVAYEVAMGANAQVRRFTGKRSQLLGTGAMSDVRLTASAGNIFVLGKDRTKIDLRGVSGWTALDLPVQAQPSTTGTIAVTSVGTDTKAMPRFDRAERVNISAIVTGSRAPATFQLEPKSAQLASPAPPVLRQKNTGAVRANSLAPGNDPTDPDAGCAVARNDDAHEAYQATAAQVEWAADLAVKGQLTITRPQNFRGSGSQPYQIQGPNGLFPLEQPANGDHVPAQVLLGVLAQESNTMHASPHLVDGETGNFNQGGFYGDWVSWDTVDCGYGVGQVTSGMAKADGTSKYNPAQQLAIATDYAANIAAALNLLIEKWNTLYALGIRANDADPTYIENWYLAAWAYNTGLQPNAANGNTTGCTPSPSCTDGQNPAHWGLGWLNNPANPIYPADRAEFDGQDPYDTKHPNLWPYPEKVIGFAYKPVSRYDYEQGSWGPAYAAAFGTGYPASTMPAHNALCVVTVNDCAPSGTTDDFGTPGAGLCTLDDLHCWWHEPINWIDGRTCADSHCGVEQITFVGGSDEPGTTNVYPANCSTAGLPPGAKVIDDTTVADPMGACQQNITNGGTFGLTFASMPPDMDCIANCITYQSKIDFHQVGGSGFGGHFWFTHTVADTEQYLQITGTWRLSAPNAWTRLFVHIPAVGAMTHQAKYEIHPPHSASEFRIIPTSYEANTWVDIGVYDMTGTGDATVDLSNFTGNGAGDDIAWDALAYQTLPGKPANFVVALGDSYSSGEGTGDYYHVTDQYGDTPALRNACRRSPHAWSRQVILPGTTRTVGELADSSDPSLSFGFAACSGATTTNVASTQQAWFDGETPAGQYGEPAQLDQGLLDGNTTLVLLTIGGNDAGFADTLTKCMKSDCPSETDIEQPIATKVHDHIGRLIHEIHLAAMNAKIVLVGYPRLFNDDADLSTCAVGCSLVDKLDLALAPSTCAMLNRVADFMVANLLQPDPENNLYTVNVIPSFAGHAISSWGSHDYLNVLTVPALTDAGLSTSGEPTIAETGMGSFHPTIAGSTFGYGAAVTNALTAI